MGELHLSGGERDALKAIDLGVLDKRIDQCVDEEDPAALRSLRLGSCGPYVASRVAAFEKAMADYAKVKSVKKRAETEDRVRRAGRDLAHALHQMKHRGDQEAKEALLFYVDDQILAPSRLNEQLTVSVSYRWRSTIGDQWQYGGIVFSHVPHYALSSPRRTPSTAQREWERQELLYREREHLMRLALYSVRDYFREGGQPEGIPSSFQAKVDRDTERLNNFSTNFWLKRAEP